MISACSFLGQAAAGKWAKWQCPVTWPSDKWHNWLLQIPLPRLFPLHSHLLHKFQHVFPLFMITSFQDLSKRKKTNLFTRAEDTLIKRKKQTMLFMLIKWQSSVKQNILAMLNYLLIFVAGAVVAGTSEFPGVGEVLIKGSITPLLCHVSRFFFSLPFWRMVFLHSSLEPFSEIPLWSSQYLNTKQHNSQACSYFIKLKHL